uniref:tRNA (guanine(9)-N(1))-methyltransferase n=1 Tax=Anas platyrhynchos platyrhynchos TaxID=8840 RepID=U3J3Y4_ANAPP
GRRSAAGPEPCVRPAAPQRNVLRKRRRWERVLAARRRRRRQERERSRARRDGGRGERRGAGGGRRGKGGGGAAPGGLSALSRRGRPAAQQGPGGAAAAGGAGVGAPALRGPRHGRPHVAEGTGPPCSRGACTPGVSRAERRGGRSTALLSAVSVSNVVLAVSCKETSRLASQIRRLYGANRQAEKPFWLYLTEFVVGSLIYEECFRMNDGFSNYLMDTTQESYLDLFPLDAIVYLTPDSENGSGRHFCLRSLGFLHSLRVKGDWPQLSHSLKILIPKKCTSLEAWWMKVFTRS